MSPQPHILRRERSAYTMPAPAHSPDAYARLVRSGSDLCGSPRIGPGARSPRNYSAPHSPESPVLSPQLSPPPFTTLRRSFSSTFTLIPEERSVSPEPPPKPPSLLRLITWYPRLLISIVRAVFAIAAHPAWRQVLVVLPTLWVAAWLWIFWKFVQCPLNALRAMVRTATGGGSRGRRRTVLLSGGSTVQTLHLARNFYSSGARVVVVEIEGLFALCKFSAAVDRFYAVPRPTVTDPHRYVRALCEVAEREGISYFVPASVTSPAYYDALAKTHLELLGCSCFVPSVREVASLDDPLEALQVCQAAGLPTPNYAVVETEADVRAWYENGGPRAGRHFLAAADARERIKFALPMTVREFRPPREMIPGRRWVIVNEVRGERFLTCTTVKDSRVVANVTCRVDVTSRGLAPRDDREVEAWIRRFLEGLRERGPVTGHVTFRLVRDAATGLLLPLGTRVGVSPPYICHTSVHSRLLIRPCRHFDRKQSGPLVVGERYWMHEAVLSTLRHPGVEAVGKLIGTVLDKREALFAYWDPLPYCAYYHFQLPFDSVRGYVRARAESQDASSASHAAPPKAMNGVMNGIDRIKNPTNGVCAS